ncbi:Zinc finger CCCH domain-containing protein 32 [Folsomia candida]|uniref:Zinc finger CCCH domain-containing protein 32 n=2 Tax=Folsomia candida TaxID=158441 RepID=A0A226EKB2_FOLCA|nr:Zinc finger CCCH domain-containing protein 32 [Folsomia candida]
MISNPSRIDRDDEKRMLPCRYFLAGFCHKGPRCKFFHPNMHIREPFIRVPDLPSSFSVIPQPGRPRREGVQSLLNMTRPRSRPSTDGGGFQTPASTNSVASLSPRSQGNEFGRRHIMSPTSHAYSEYQACSRLMTDYNEEDDEDFDEKSNYQERRQIQNTIFNHIDWSEFLVPGVSPPQPTPVPDLPSSFSVVSQPGRPGRPRREGVQSLLNMSGPRSRPATDFRILASANSASSLSPSSQANEIFARRHVLSSSADHQAGSRGMDTNDDENSPEREQIQNTVFNHINWSEFLVPGVSPPEPTPIVPDPGTTPV